MAKYGVRHLATEYSKYQPVRQNNFEMLVDFSGIQLFKPTSSQQNDAADLIKSDEAQEVINFSVISFKPPHFNQEEIEIKRGNSKVYFAGVPTFETGDLVINDFVTADGKSILMAWQACSYDVVNDTIPSSEKYKVKATVLEYLPDNTLIRSWDLYGCWVKQLTEDGWDNESAQKKKVTATIRYDYAIPRTGDDN